MSVIAIESVSFQHPARVGASTVTGASNSLAGGAPCEIRFDPETGLVLIKHLPSKKESIIPLSNIAGMVPLPASRK